MDINFGQIILQAVNFGLLLFLLTKFLYRPIVKTLEERSQKITAGLKAAEDSIKEREQLEKTKRQQLIKAEQKAATILDQARQDAEKTGKDIVAQAKAAAQKEAQKEYQLIKEKITEQRHQLKKDISDLVVSATKAVLKDSLTLSQQKTIINNQIKQLKNIQSNS